MPPIASQQQHNFDYDVFVSYAQANDHDGWVTRFKDKLTDFLNERLDWTPRFFWDEQSIGINDDLDTKITASVRNSAVMVVVVSHKYLTRPWCALERETFLKDGNERRVMVVRYDDVPFQEFQEVLPKCLGIEFFDNDGLPLEIDSREFKKRLHKLRETIVDEIEDSQHQADARHAAGAVVTELVDQSLGGSPGKSGNPRVFVAPVPPASTEMVTRRDELISFLDDCDIETVTPADYFFMQPDFDSMMNGDLDGCHGFVQLLDTSPFPPPPNMPNGVERWFLDRARERDQLANLRWRRAEPAEDSADFAALANEADVRPFEFARFCELVRDEVRSRHRNRQAVSKLDNNTAPPLLVLRADPDDEALGEAIAKQFESHPLDLMDVPSTMLESLDDVASQLSAGGLLVVFRRSRDVLRRIQELRKFTASEAAKHWVLGFWNSPEDPQKAIRPRALKNVHIINDGDAEALSGFVSDLIQKTDQA